MPEREFLLADYIPDDPLMAIAWRDCLMWAVGFGPIVDAFRRDTGCIFPSGQVSGTCEAFIPWFQEHVWGGVGDPYEETAACFDPASEE